MITVTESVSAFDTYHEILGYSPGNSLFFDIETTGFSPSNSMVFLIGVLFYDNGCWKLSQFLAEDLQDELSVLRAFLDTASRYDTLIHFNGSTFDLPYLAKKADSYGLNYVLDSFHSLDLYKKYRPLGKILALEHMKQRSLEAFIGWQREDRLTGKHMVSLFQKYTASKEPGLRELLLLHNHDDMLGMTQILSLTAYLAMFDGLFADTLPIQHVLKPANRGEDLPAQLQLSCSLLRPIPAGVTLDSTYHLHAEGSRAALQIPFYDGIMYHFFPDHKNYYYLPLEDQAIHKSVAAYVDKEYRTPAKACNCYIKKSGQFLPQPEELILPAFKCSFGSPEIYFAYSNDLVSDTEKLSAYVSAILRSFRQA